MSNVLDSLGRIKIVASTGTVGGNVWPKADKLNIDTTEYSSVATAIAALLASQQLLVGEGSYTCSNQTISTNSFLHGAGMDVSIWTVANAASTLTLSATAFQMQDLTIQMTAGTTASAAALYCSGTDAILGFHNVKISQVSAAGGTRYTALFDIQSNGIATLFDCVLIGDASGGGTVYALELDTGSVNLYGGLIQGNVRVSGGTTLSLYGPRITGTITNSGTIKGWYFDTNGNLIVIDASGTSSGVWLIDEDLTLKTKEATLAAAISASASGDSIKLDTDTYSVSASQNIDTSITIEGDGPEATIYTTSVSNAPIFDITTDNITVVFKDLTLKHTGGGVAATGIFSNNSGVTVVLDNAVLEISSGAGTASRGLWIESGTWILRNGSKIVVTSGTSKYGIYNDAGAATITIGAGCTVNGATADVYSDQAGSTLNLLDCVLTNAITDFAGTKQGTAFDQYGRKLRVKPIGIFAGRMTLTTATPVTTADVTAATTIYLTPYNGGEIEVYNGYLWIEAKFTELSLSLSGFTADKNSDLWVYDNAGTLALERTQWTNDTTRATALALQDGLNVKSGTVTRLYCGTFRTTGTTGQCEDSVLKRYVWNNFNRITKSLVLADTTSETTNTASWRQYRATAANQVNVVVGLAENVVDLIVLGDCSAGTGGWYANSFGYDSTTSPFGVYFLTFSTVRGGVFSIGRHYPAIGYHYYALIEITSGAVATSSAAYLQGGFAC